MFFFFFRKIVLDLNENFVFLKKSMILSVFALINVFRFLKYLVVLLRGNFLSFRYHNASLLQYSIHHIFVMNTAMDTATLAPMSECATIVMAQFDPNPNSTDFSGKFHKCKGFLLTKILANKHHYIVPPLEKPNHLIYYWTPYYIK